MSVEKKRKIFKPIPQKRVLSVLKFEDQFNVVPAETSEKIDPYYVFGFCSGSLNGAATFDEKRQSFKLLCEIIFNSLTIIDAPSGFVVSRVGAPKQISEVKSAFGKFRDVLGRWWMLVGNVVFVQRHCNNDICSGKENSLWYGKLGSEIFVHYATTDLLVDTWYQADWSFSILVDLFTKS